MPWNCKPRMNPQDSISCSPAGEAPSLPPGQETPAKKFGKRPQGIPPNEWLSAALRRISLLSFIITNLGLMASIIALTIQSSRWQGFATIAVKNDASDTALINGTLETGPQGESDSLLSLGLVWTALPTVIFQLFSAHWAWISGALAERQPYVELRNGSASAQRSILLDYRATALPLRWWRAFRLRHSTIAVALLASLVLQFLAAPLSARLFAPKDVMLPSTASVSFSSAFNETSLGDLDWRPAIHTTAATLVYGGQHIPWTDGEFSFRPFTAVAPQINNTFHIAAETMAYSAYVSCEAIREYVINLVPSGQGRGEVTVAGNDRGCPFQLSTAVTASAEVYFRGKAVADCPPASNFGRLVFAVGTYSASSPYLLSNLSIISCATLYRTAPVMLGLTLTGATGAPVIRSSAESGRPDTTRAAKWKNIEFGILGSVVFNPGLIWSTSDFGVVVLNQAQKKAPAHWLTPENLIQAISKAFTGVYSIAVATNAFDSTFPVQETVIGTALEPTTRLFVVYWAAYLVLAILALTLFTACWVIFYVRKTRSILTEEPEGLLSSAGIIEGSDLIGLVGQIRERDEIPDGRVRHIALGWDYVTEGTWSAGDMDNRGCWSIKRETTQTHQEERSGASTG